MMPRTNQEKTVFNISFFLWIFFKNSFGLCDTDNHSNSYSFQEVSENDWQEINLVPPGDRDELCKLCRGTYVDPSKTRNKDDGSKSNLIQAKANKAELRPNNVSLYGNFEVKQDDRLLSGDRAELSRNEGVIKLNGNIAIRERGLLLRGDQAIMQTKGREAKILNAGYILHERHLHGTAETLRRNKQGVVELENGNFSYCSPLGKPSWLLATDTMRLDPKKEVGEARGATLRIRGVPIIYLPWIEFPIGDRRKTGFLWPEVHSAPRGGIDLSLPFYFNLAENYDLQYTPRYIQERGLNQFLSARYLGENFGSWETSGAFLKSDNLYLEENPGQTNNDRWQVRIKHRGQTNTNWISKIDYSRVSDADYLKDLDNFGFSSRRATSLRQYGSLRFLADRWSLDLNLLQFQSLTYGVAQKYKTLPKITLQFLGKETPFSLNPIFMLQYANFDSDLPVVTGKRLYGEAGLSFPMQWKFGFFKPTIRQRSVSYALDNNSLIESKSPTTNSFSGNIDAGIFLERKTSLLGLNFIQTLEPRLYYSYGKYVDQRNLPIFDTSKITFDYKQLYRGRQYAGYDRLEAKNQLSMGLTTRYINDINGKEYLNASIGKIFYFHSGREFFSDFPPEASPNESNVFVEANFLPSANFNFNGSAEYDPSRNKLQRGNLGFGWNSNDGKIINIEHSYRRMKNEYLKEGKINETRIATYIPLDQRWHIMGAWNYNWDLKSSMEDLFGIEYDSCCWKVRLIYSRYIDRAPGQFNFSAYEPGLKRDESIQFQILLKGMGSAGPRVDKLLSTMIRGLNFEEK